MEYDDDGLPVVVRQRHRANQGRGRSIDGKGATRRRARRPLVVLAGVSLTLSICALAVGLVLLAAERRPTRTDITFPGPLPQDRTGQTWLIVGSDRRTGHLIDPEGIDTLPGDPPADPNAALADLVLVARRDSTGTRLVTIPRDLVVSNSDGMPYRLTQVNDDGPQEMITTLCRSLGLTFDHMITIGMEGFEHTVDSAGGIDVTLDEPVRDMATGIDLAAGTHHLDGRDTLALVRSRNSGSDGSTPDIATVENGIDRRTRMGGQVFRSLGERVWPPWRHPIRGARVAWTLLGAVTLDRNTSLNDLRDLVSLVATSTSELLPSEPMDGTRGSITPVRSLGPGSGSVLESIGARLDPGSGRPIACDAP